MAGPPSSGVTLTPEEIAWLVLDAGWTGDNAATAVAIVLAESGGKTNAYRPASANPRGGNDRGLWQINDKAHPALSDQDAYWPPTATAYAYGLWQRSGWGPWNYGPRAYTGRPRTDLNITRGRQAIANPKNPNFQVPTMPGTGIEQVGELVSNLAPDWMGRLAQLLGNLLSGEWWRRIGVAVLGVGMIIAAIALAHRGILTKGIVPS